ATNASLPKPGEWGNLYDEASTFFDDYRLVSDHHQRVRTLWRVHHGIESHDDEDARPDARLADVRAGLGSHRRRGQSGLRLLHPQGRAMVARALCRVEHHRPHRRLLHLADEICAGAQPDLPRGHRDLSIQRESERLVLGPWLHASARSGAVRRVASI